MNLAFGLAYLALPLLAWWKVRSIAWVVIAVGAATAVVGAAISFAHDRQVSLVSWQLQVLLLGALLAVAIRAWVRPSGVRPHVPVRRQFFSVVLPVLALLALVAITTSFWNEEPAFLRPVSYLIGQSTAEDNAKWLDFTAQWASADGIYQGVPLGGPLQLFLTFVATWMGVFSQILLGGFNEVAVAANTVIFGEYLLAIAAPVAFAALAEVRYRGASGERGFIPIPLLWLGMLVLSTVSLVVVAYGHLTLQFTFLVTGLWVATFLSQTRLPRARLLTSITAVAAMTVWLPLNVIAVVVLTAWIVLYLSRWARTGAQSVDWWGFALLIVVGVGVVQPTLSSLNYLLFSSVGAAVPVVMGAAGAAVAPGLADSLLFSATGGTEQPGPLLIGMAGLSAIAASIVVTRQSSSSRTSAYRSFAPLALLAAVSLGIVILDFWSTGSGPHYGSMKFGFLVAGVALATTVPIALLALDPQRVDGMSLSRWVAVAGALLVLAVDSILPRAVTQLRPELWSPPIPFNNTSGSYWWPADVNGESQQSIASNPLACVYLPEGYPAPTAIVPSGLSDPQRVYSCTRQLAGLSGLDTQAQPVVDWLRREWLTNTPAWSDVYDGLAGLPDAVLDKPVILLDDGSNVKGLESLRSLLQRFPKSVTQQP